MMPLWLDPTPLTREFVGSFANAPVREISQAHEFRAARLEADQAAAAEREARRIDGARRQREGLERAWAARRAAAAAMCAQTGETMVERRRRLNRERWQRIKAEKAAQEIPKL